MNEYTLQLSFIELKLTRLSCTVPSRPPRQVQGNNQSSTSLLITWSAIPAGYTHGIIVGYNVYLNNNSRNVVGAGARMITLTGLNKYTPYIVQISANTSKGEGPRSPPITVWTDEDGKCCWAKHCTNRKQRKKRGKLFSRLLPRALAERNPYV